MPDPTPTSNELSVIALICDRRTVRRSFRVALVVGTVLVLINQGDRLLAGQSPDWLKLVLTYCVPYCVATYGAVGMAIDAARARR